MGPRCLAGHGAVYAALSFPEIEQPFEFVSLRHPDEYPFNEGRIVSSKGLDIANTEWNDWFVEEHVERSNALHSASGRAAPITWGRWPALPSMRLASSRRRSLWPMRSAFRQW